MQNSSLYLLIKNSIYIINLNSESYKFNIINFFAWNFQLFQSSWNYENVNKDFIFFKYKCYNFIKINSLIFDEEILKFLNQWISIIRNNQQNINIKHIFNQFFWMILNKELWNDKYIEMLQILSNFIHLCKITSDNTDDLKWFKILF